MERGEIWLANSISSEKNVQHLKDRPVIIITNDRANQYSPLVNVIPLTSKDKKGLPVHVNVYKECGIIEDSIALVEQERPINKESLIRKVGDIDFKTMKNIELAILIHHGIDFNIINQFTA